MNIKDLIKKKRILILLAGLFSVGLIVCGLLTYNDTVRISVVSNVMNKVGLPTKVIQASNEVTDVFKSDNKEAINDILVETKINEYAEEYPEFFDEEESSIELGVLNDLFQFAEVKVDSYNETKITYVVETVDMSNFFINMQSKVDANTTEDEFRQMILDYAENSNVKNFKVNTDYVYEEGNFKADYYNAEFLNAMSGGFLESYAAIYSEYLNEMFEVVNTYE